VAYTDDEKWMKEAVEVLISETAEALVQVDFELIELERNPKDQSGINTIFRAFHTTKGNADSLGFNQLKLLTHAAENLLDEVRAGKLVIDSSIIDTLLNVVDAVRSSLAMIEEKGHDTDQDWSSIITTLNHLIPEKSAANIREEKKPQPRKKAVPAAKSPKKKTIKQKKEGKKAASLDVVAKDENKKSEVQLGEKTLRVNASILDNLMDQVGELVLARNEILQLVSQLNHDGFTQASHHLNSATAELQEGLMRARLQAVGKSWVTFPRLVRDLSAASGKKIRIFMEGEETELDRTLIEAIHDPLVHLIRNASDHGIELPGERKKMGKPQEGKIFIRAYHDAGQVSIEVADDGAGINPDKVRKAALDLDLIDEEQLSQVSENEIIMWPGFSTAGRVSEISGRGVGLDIVQTNIERLGGSIDVHSEIGKGTTFRLKVPLTLAILSALIVISGQNRYAIPRTTLLELVRLEGEEARSGIEYIQGTPVHRLRGKLLRLIFLSDILNTQIGDQSHAPDVNELESVNIVVSQVSGRQIGFVVDEIIDNLDIVVKPLSRHIKAIPFLAGATVLGDGKSALILDVNGLAQNAVGFQPSEEHKQSSIVSLSKQVQMESLDKRNLFIFEGPNKVTMAVPLDLVSRIEKIPYSNIVRTGVRNMVQYRDVIMPLLFLSSFFSDPCNPWRCPPENELPISEEGTLPVLVYAHKGCLIGVVINDILDVVETDITIQGAKDHDGVLGTAVVRNEIVEFLDLKGIVAGLDLSTDQTALTG